MSIPNTIVKPTIAIEIDTSGASQGLPTAVARVLLIATKLTTGTATAATPIQVLSEGDARDYFGDGSPAALMCKAVLEENPYISELWVCPLAEAGGSVAASGTLTVAVDTQTSGTLTVWIGRFSVEVAVSADDTDVDIAENIAIAVNADTTLPVTAISEDEVVTLEAQAKGTSGNKWVLDTEVTGTGLTVTVVQPTSGATDASIQTALDAVVGEQFDLIVSEWADTTRLGLLDDHLTFVSGPMEQRPGVGIAGVVGSVSAATTVADALNSGRMLLVEMRGTRTHPMELAAALAAELAAEDDLARPLNDVQLSVGLAPETLSDYLTRTEQETLLKNGVTCCQVGPARVVQIVRTVSTYTTDTHGSADLSLRDIQTIRVLDYVRYAVRARLQTRLAQTKLSSKAVTKNTTDPDKVRTLILGVLLECQDEKGYLQDVEALKGLVTVTKNSGDPGRLDIDATVRVVSGLHVVAGKLRLTL